MNTNEQRLAEILLSVGEHLDTASPAPQRATPSRRYVSVIRATVLALVLGGSTLVVPSVRAAVGRLLRIGSTTIEVGPTQTSTTTTPGAANPSSLAAGLTIINRAAAEAALEKEAPLLVGRYSAFETSKLGPPAGYAAMPEGGLLIIWTDGSTLWVHQSSVSPKNYFRKMVGSNQAITQVSGIGDDALAIEGQHFLTTPHRTVTSTSTVLWVTDGTEFRLESNRPIVDLIEVARSIAISLGP